MIMETTANFFGMRPTPKHTRSAQAHKFRARIRHSHHRAHLRLGVGGLTEKEACDECNRADAKKHDGLRYDLSCLAEFAATTSAAEVTIGQPVYEKVPIPGRPPSPGQPANQNA